MLRITTDDNPQVLTLRLEGRLEGPWVEVLTECWRGALAGSASRRRSVDLNGVTFIDGEGKARLAQMHARSMAAFATDSKDFAAREQADLLAALLMAVER